MWSPLAGGLLSGKYRRGQQPPAGSRQLTDWDEPPVYDQEGLYDTIEVLVKIAEQRGVSAAQVALAYTLAKPAVTSLVIGARTDEQLADNLAAASLALSDDERAQLDAVSAPPLLYPYWHQAKTARDRLSPADLTLLAPTCTRPAPPVVRSSGCITARLRTTCVPSPSPPPARGRGRPGPRPPLRDRRPATQAHRRACPAPGRPARTCPAQPPQMPHFAHHVPLPEFNGWSSLPSYRVELHTIDSRLRSRLWMAASRG